jgi:hypothetical protein
LPEAHKNLGLGLMLNGRFAEARRAFERGRERCAKQPGWADHFQQLVAYDEQLIALEQQLPAFLRGDRQPQSVAEALKLDELCRYTKRYAAAVRFSRAAFALDAKQEEAHGYNAACSAALAAAGKGQDAADLTAGQKAELRRQALGWLRADLARWPDRLRKTTPQNRIAAQRALRHWQQDADLSSVRDQAALAKLPVGEQQAWRRLWDDLAALLPQAGTP